MNKKNINRKIEHKKKPNFDLKKMINYILAISLIINIVLLFIVFKSDSNNQDKFDIAIGRASYTPNSLAVIRDSDDPAFTIKTAQLWDNSTGKFTGFIAIFKINNFPDCTMIIDTDVNIKSLNLLKPLYLRGEKQNINNYFYKFTSIGLQGLIGNDGLFKADNPLLVNFTDKFKDSLIKTMKTMYIKMKGIEEFNRLYPNGITLASVGSKLKNLDAVDINGKRIDLNYIKGKKSAFIYVDTGCGSCKSKCATMRDMMQSMNVNIIFIASGEKTEVEDFIKQDVKGEPLIYDNNEKIANLLYLGEPAYLMLVDENLNIKYKKHIGDIAEDAEPGIKEFFK